MVSASMTIVVAVRRRRTLALVTRLDAAPLLGRGAALLDVEVPFAVIAVGLVDLLVRGVELHRGVVRGAGARQRARALLAYLAVSGRAAQELAQAREIRAALIFEARLVGAMATKAKLHEHPEWPVFVEELVSALARIPGALDALDASLARAEERKAAA